MDAEGSYVWYLRSLLAIWNTAVSVAVLFLIPQTTALHFDPYKRDERVTGSSEVNDLRKMVNPL